MSGIFGEFLTFRQEQGPPVRLRTIGDEKYSRYETLDGYTVVYDDGAGVYCYATLDDGGQFVSTGLPISGPAPDGLPRHLREDNLTKNARIVDRFEAMVPPTPDGEETTRMLTFGPSGGLLPGRLLNTGNVRGLTILVTFPDTPTTVSRSDVDLVLNSTTPAHGNAMSVNQYFKTISTGRLNFTNVVVGPLMMSKTKLSYANTEGLLVPEAIRLAEAAGVDFSQFDSLHEGIVDSLCIMYAGQTEYRGDLWPHNWTHRRAVAGGVRTELYIVTSMGSGPAELSIGTFIHESGHLLCRFPDLYDYGMAEREGDDFDSAGLGYYCVMAGGNHLDKGKTPAPVSVYLRHLAKWCPKVVDLKKPGTYQAVHGAYDTAMRYSSGFDNEYFLVENRSRLGLDAHLPSSGLAVFHCDTRGSNEFQQGTPAKHYQAALLQADGHRDLEGNINGGDGGDLYGVTAGTAVSHSTKPASLWWNGSEAGLTVSAISAPGPTITFTVGSQATAGTKVGGESTPKRAIPDNKVGGITDAIQIQGQGTVRKLNVAVDITHPFIGDLKVELVSPTGKVADLHSRTGWWRDDLHLNLDSNPPSRLQPLVGQPVAGAWLLRVSDNGVKDTGTLDRWRIEIETGT